MPSQLMGLDWVQFPHSMEWFNTRTGERISELALQQQNNHQKYAELAKLLQQKTQQQFHNNALQNALSQHGMSGAWGQGGLGQLNPSPQAPPQDPHLELAKQRFRSLPLDEQRKYEGASYDAIDEFLWLKAQVDRVCWRAPITHL